MAEKFSEDLKRRVLQANNIVDVVQSAVGKLTRAGRNLKACCPFHNEKTPSFNVNVEGQYFKCFGCGKGGDVITFVMLHERVSFPEAFQLLADRAGIRVEHDPRAAEQYTKERDFKSYLYRLNDAAAKFYREQLFTDSGKAAREYIKKRGLSDEICERFRIGYAPAGGSPLLARLQSQKAPLKAIMAAGLASVREDGSARDFFYDRLIFPITNMDGRVIAFGGRILGLGEPKYLNTRDTLLFSKTSTVYGMDHAKEEVKESKRAAIVEGYTDVMMCHQFGVTNVVACLGTAITAEHVRQLRRVADELLILTDSDAAGAKASERSLAVLFQEEMPAKIARLPGADKDPCDFLLSHGKDPFVEALGNPVELFEYKFEMVVKKHDVATPLGLKNAAEELMALVSLIPDTLLKNRYRYEILRRLNIDERDLRYDNVQRRTPQAAEAEPSPEADVGSCPPPESELAGNERELLGFLFHEPAWLEQAVTEVDLAALTGGPERLVGRCILEALGEGKLPPEVKVLENTDPGSIVAREVLQRLQQVADDGIVKLDAARALCVALAEAPPKGTKLDPRARLDMLVRSISAARLYMRHREAGLRLTRAKLHGDVKAEEEASREVAVLLREIVRLKRMPGA
jgi:DNA primase